MKEIENKYIKFWFEEGLLISELKNPVHVTLELMIEFIELRHRISDDEHQYWCFNGTKFLSLSNDARDYADKYGQDLIFACAFVVNSQFSRAVFNTYVKLKKPKIPFLSFTKKEKAIKWLLEIKEKNNNLK
jgi:hypothetical protein